MDVVTGGAGFIGSHLARGLLQRGHSVRVIDNLATGSLKNIEGLSEEYGGRFEFYQADIRDFETLKRLLAGSEVVYHQAAIPSVQRSVQDPLLTNSSNVEGTLNLLTAAREVGVERIVYASSSSVYGDSETLPKHEGMQPNPKSPYAVSKYVSELYGRVFFEIHGLKTVGLRYFNVFGPRQDPSSDYAAVIPKFITRLLDNQSPVIYGDGNQSRDFTYIDNVIEANLRAASAESGGVAVNVGCGARYSLNQLLEVLNEILGKNIEPVYADPRPGDVRHSLASIDQARKVIGFQPLVGFREGLERTVDFFQRSTFTQP